MTDLELAQDVATKTAERLREVWVEELNALRDQWLMDLGKLRDDLTVEGLIRGASCGLDCPLRKKVTSSVKGATVLVVDDYPGVKTVLVRILEDAGMHTFGATTGAEAIVILAEQKDIDVVISDAVMPKNGHSLLEFVRETYPTIEVIMTSGYTNVAEKARELGAFCFLPKPFSADQAVMLIEKAVELRRFKMARAKP